MMSLSIAPRFTAWPAALLVLALAGCGSPSHIEPALADVGATAAQVAGTSTAASMAVVGLPAQASIADLAARVAPSVVNISTVHRVTAAENDGPFGFFGKGRRPPREKRGAGTGFIIDSDGYVVTNAHVVANAEQVDVRLHDDRQYKADVVGRDAKLDLALIKLRDVSELPSVGLGDSHGLRVGEHVMAVGNPFGLGHTVTLGIVSAKERSIGAGPYDNFIQTDASINPGNSGGPLFNLRGEVVGINTAIRAGADGIGFAIPVNSLKDIVAQLKDKGFVERGMLGLTFQALTPELAVALGMQRPHGALVSDVLPGSSAGRAGIRSGDVIVEVDNVPIRRSEELARNVARHGPGSTIAVKLWRDGELLERSATLDRLEDDQPKPPRTPAKPTAPSNKHGSQLGMQLQNSPAGVRIVRLSRPNKALREGDLIISVNRRPVRDTNTVKDALKHTKKGVALLQIRRGDRQRYVAVPLR